MTSELVPGGGAAVSDRLVALVAGLRERGVAVGVDGTLAAHRALLATAPWPRAAHAALRAVLCGARADYPAFDAAFEEAFATFERADRAPPEPLAPAAPELVPADVRPPDLPEASPSPSAARPWSPSSDDGGSEIVRGVRRHGLEGSAGEVRGLMAKDVARYTEEEHDLARQLMRRLAVSQPLRRTRGLRSTRRRTSQLDTPETVRSLLRHAGEPIDRVWLQPRQRPRQIVLVCDVSGSMAPYSKMLLQYMHATVRTRVGAEAFVFGTQLTRITLDMRNRDLGAALDKVTAAVGDWSGGTRIGGAIAELNRTHGRRIARGAVAVVLSDGCDRGDPAQLGAEMARLRRSTRRLIWVNPLKHRPGYEPLTRGMTAALPHLDRFLEGHSLGSLMELTSTLEDELGGGLTEVSGADDGIRRALRLHR